MVQEIAKKGRGSCSLVGNEVDNLNGLVVTALSRAFEPSFEGCTLKYLSSVLTLLKNKILTFSSPRTILIWLKRVLAFLRLQLVI
jgi:hypothetical protein